MSGIKYVELLQHCTFACSKSRSSSKTRNLQVNRNHQLQY